MSDRQLDDELVMSLVELALDLPADERELYIRAACSGSSALFEKVWNYVQWEERMNGFLAAPLYTPAGDEDRLEPGRVLHDRFRIIREVGHGGMGVVYEAVDAKLDRRIAVKCARPGFHARLSPEVRHASEIAHPNVCRIYEIHTGSSGRGEFDFVTMEFVEGRTLGERLRKGTVPFHEAQIIAAQLCAGLGEAHKRQVIHGDLKSTNILIVETPGGVRAVITDFGMAASVTPQAGNAPAEAGGTLDYMAPELLAGAAPSAKSDIYALGVILHELAVGRRPFDKDASWAERLKRRPPVLRHPWGRMVACCLDPDPEWRCADVAKVAAAIDPSRVVRRRAIAAAAVIAALASGIIAYRAAPGTAETIRLAVLPFETDPGSRHLDDGLVQEAADRLSAARGGRMRLVIIPPGDVVQYRVDAPEKAVRVLGATHALSGSVRREGGRTVVRGRLTDARSQIPLRDWQAEYAPSEMRYAPQALAAMVAGALGLPPLRAGGFVNSAAYADFSAGTAVARQPAGVDAAIPLLERAAEADPDSPLTHARLAEARALKYHLTNDAAWLERAKEALEAARRRNPDLAIVLLVSAMIGEYEGVYDDAEKDLLRALQLEPQNGDIWRRLGRVYQDSSQFAKGEAAYRNAIEVQPAYFKNYQALCALYVQQAEYESAIDQCRKMAQLTPDLWEAHFALGIPYFSSGNYAQGEAEFREALALNPASSKVLQSLGVALFYQSRFAEAAALFRRAIEAGPDTYLLELDLGTALQLDGKKAEAVRSYREGVILAEKELAKNPRDGAAKSRLALLWARLNEPGLAESEAEQGWRLAPGSVEVEEWLVRTYEVLGQRNRSLEFARRLPVDSLRRLNQAPDLVELRRDSGFQKLLASRNTR